jgi:hypothetical protein
MSQKKKLAIIGLLIAGLLIVPVVIQVTLSLISLRANTPQVPKENPLKISSIESWETHIDSEKGYSVKYPPEMYLSDTPFPGYITTFLLTDLKPLRELGLPDEVTPRVQVFAIDTPLEEFVAGLNENRSEDQFPEFSQIELNGSSAYQTKAFDQEVIFTHTVFGDDNKSFLIELFTIEKENDELKKAYEDMISTFEIL